MSPIVRNARIEIANIKIAGALRRFEDGEISWEKAQNIIIENKSFIRIIETLN